MTHMQADSRLIHLQLFERHIFDPYSQLEQKYTPAWCYVSAKLAPRGGILLLQLRIRMKNMPFEQLKVN